VEYGTRLLNEDGSASMSTILMLSHHGLRRDCALFAIALEGPLTAPQRVSRLKDEWKSYHATLHGHHAMEDARIFQSFASDHPELVPVIDGLADDHRRIAPLLVEGDRAFSDLPATQAAARAIVKRLSDMLGPHLATEEEKLVPLLREAKQFPPVASEAELDLFSQGFAWSCHGIAPEVLEQVNAMLPKGLRERLPAARAAYAHRCEQVWGSAKTGTSHTSVPDWCSTG